MPSGQACVCLFYSPWRPLLLWLGYLIKGFIGHSRWRITHWMFCCWSLANCNTFHYLGNVDGPSDVSRDELEINMNNKYNSLWNSNVKKYTHFVLWLLYYSVDLLKLIGRGKEVREEGVGWIDGYLMISSLHRHLSGGHFDDLCGNP